MNTSNHTPGIDTGMTLMMRQYTEMRAQSVGLLAFQVGDWFEFFGDDAVNVSRVLDIALTQRGNMQMCGFACGPEFPHNPKSQAVCLTSSRGYFQALVMAGYAVSVAMQTEVVDGRMQRRIIGTFRPADTQPNGKHCLTVQYADRA